MQQQKLRKPKIITPRIYLHRGVVKNIYESNKDYLTKERDSWN